MTTTAPTTLHEYQEFVRKEALKIQADMGWPDEKMNATLRALGLPEKLVFRIPLKVTIEQIVVFRVDDAASEDEARQSIRDKSPEELERMVRNVTPLYGRLADTELTEMPTTFAVGDNDTTLTNSSVNAAYRGENYCENYEPDRGRHYCTRRKGHDGQHAQGDSGRIVAVWDNTDTEN